MLMLACADVNTLEGLIATHGLLRLGWGVNISTGFGIVVTDIQTDRQTDTTDCYNPCACALRVNKLDTDTVGIYCI